MPKKSKSAVCCVLSPKKVGLALGLFCALTMFVLGLAASVGWGVEMVNIVASLYIGYTATFVGSIIGAVYGFVDGFIGGAIFAWIYNWVEKKVR